MSSVNPTLNVLPAKVDTVQPPKAVERQMEAVRKVAKSQPEQELQEQPTVTSVQEAVDEVNKALYLLNERLEFSVHEATNRIVVRVLDRET